MVRTRVGYTGGSIDDPTYHQLGNHTEALQVDYDPETLSDRELLSAVIRRHDPFNNVGHTQYRNGLWYHDSDQLDAIRSVLRNNFGCSTDSPKIETVIEPLETFHRAEAYHQKYYLRKHNEYMELFKDLTDEDFTDSTKTARLNGILAGKTSNSDVLDPLALPDHLERDLRSRLS